MNEIILRAHAKVNLTLDVGLPRADGYHEIRSVMQTISLHDALTMRQIRGRSAIALAVSGDEAQGVPSDMTNIVYQAAARMQKIAGTQNWGLSIHLHKNIPSQAGLGGGSSDAAAALRGLNALLRLDLPQERLAEIGAELGADVPFFLFGGTALVEGKGERVTPLPDPAAGWDFVIIKPPVGVSTAWAYNALDRAPGRAPRQCTDLWLSGQQTLANDFEEVVVPAVPEVRAIFQWVAEDKEIAIGTRPALCGSGAAVFCRARSREAAARLAQRAQEARLGKAWAVATVGREC